MSVRTVSETVLYVGVDDTTLDLFESQYPVPNGISYNSYVILDEKIAIMDTVDARASAQWLENLSEALGNSIPDYVVVSHMEPDHTATLDALVARYPDIQVVGNAKTFMQMEQFFPQLVAKDKQCVVKEGDVLALGVHSLHFVMAPMVHWPEVMVAYEESEKILFSADAFGTFSTFMQQGDWEEEAHRYFINIVGKYGVQVQGLLKKAAALDIETICALHGPVLRGEAIAAAVALYDAWSSYRAQAPNDVLVAYASIHGNTKAAALQLAEMLRDEGMTVTAMDLTRVDVSYAVAEAFRCGKVVLAAATYDATVFPAMESFIAHLKTKNYQKRTVALMENGTWAPMAAKIMRAELEGFKEMNVLPEVVSIKSKLNEASFAQMQALCSAVCAQ